MLSWRGVEFTLTPALEAPLRQLLAGEILRADAFADAASGADVQAFLRDMVRRGAFIARPEED